ncbi:MAG TPA: SGNH/GDSL hydrolase family protein [Daejeonella sp.]|nr:SGNH/GDSL hydrolase family protein [Daejeonella sp.]
MQVFRKKLAVILAALSFYFSLNSASAQDFQKWEEAILKFEKADQHRPVKKGEYIVFTGSSSIVGWQNLGADFPDKKVLNRAFGGSQTFEVLHFANRIITPYKPKQVVIYSGDNDIAAGKSPETVFSDFKALFNKIRREGGRTVVTFISIKPSPSRKQFMPKIVEANMLVKEFLKTKNRTSYVDMYTSMLLPNGNPKPELFKADSLHMVQAGYDLWRKTLKPYLK